MFPVVTLVSPASRQHTIIVSHGRFSYVLSSRQHARPLSGHVNPKTASVLLRDLTCFLVFTTRETDLYPTGNAEDLKKEKKNRTDKIKNRIPTYLPIVRARLRLRASREKKKNKPPAAAAAAGIRGDGPAKRCCKRHPHPTAPAGGIREPGGGGAPPTGPVGGRDGVAAGWSLCGARATDDDDGDAARVRRAADPRRHRADETRPRAAQSCVSNRTTRQRARRRTHARNARTRARTRQPPTPPRRTDTHTRAPQSSRFG